MGRIDQLLPLQGFLNNRVGDLHMIRVFQRSAALVPIQLLSLFSGQTSRITQDLSFGELVLDKLPPSGKTWGIGRTSLNC